MPFTSKNLINMTLTVLFSLALVMSKISTDYFVAWFTGHTKKSISHHQWWLNETSLVQFEDTQRCLDTLACSAPSHPCSAFLCTIIMQTLWMPKSSVIILHFSFFMSCWLMIIWIVNWWSPHKHLMLTLVLLVEGLPLQESSFFTSLHLFFEPLISLKNMCAQHSVISIHLLKHFMCLWQFSLTGPKIFKFVQCSSFVPQCS